MQLPRAVAVFNKYVNNRIQGLWAPYLLPWAVLHHRGRTPGQAYKTPVLAFVVPEGFAVPMLYGPQTQWARNLLAAGGGEVRRGGRRYRLVDPRVVPAADITGGGIGGRYVRSGSTTLVATLEPLPR